MKTYPCPQQGGNYDQPTRPRFPQRSGASDSDGSKAEANLSDDLPKIQLLFAKKS